MVKPKLHARVRKGKHICKQSVLVFNIVIGQLRSVLLSQSVGPHDARTSTQVRKPPPNSSIVPFLQFLGLLALLLCQAALGSLANLVPHRQCGGQARQVVLRACQATCNACCTQWHAGVPATGAEQLAGDRNVVLLEDIGLIGGYHDRACCFG